MPDTPFKAMGREPRTQAQRFADYFGGGHRPNSVTCEKCGGRVAEGDWPFCKGDPADHRRD